jgi:hypothetical protein
LPFGGRQKILASDWKIVHNMSGFSAQGPQGLGVETNAEMPKAFSSGRRREVNS